MASAVEIANLALSKLGDEGEITSLEENTRAARTINGCFVAMRDAVLRDHPWNFATRRAQLPALADAVVWGDWTAFSQPADFIRLLEVDGTDAQQIGFGQTWWQIEGRQILARRPGPLNIRYTARIEESGLWDALFVEALACRIAMQSALRLTGSQETLRAMRQLYKDALGLAKQVDGQDNPAEELPDSHWFLSREAG
jgi:hypothetical protein